MSKKLFWTGLGSGMIAGALLLQLTLTVSDHAELPSMEPHDDQVKLYTEAEMDELLQLRLEEAMKKLVQTTPEPTPEPEPEQAGEPTPESENPAEVPSQIEKQTVLYVAYRMSAEEVADMLHKSGLITDPVAFIAEMKNRKLTGKIRTGVHLFEGAPTEDDIYENLVAPNKNNS